MCVFQEMTHSILCLIMLQTVLGFIQFEIFSIFDDHDVCRREKWASGCKIVEANIVGSSKIRYKIGATLGCNVFEKNASYSKTTHHSVHKNAK